MLLPVLCRLGFDRLERKIRGATRSREGSRGRLIEGPLLVGASNKVGKGGSFATLSERALDSSDNEELDDDDDGSGGSGIL